MMISIEEASNIIADTISRFPRPKTVELRFSKAQDRNVHFLGRVLAQDVYSEINVPEFDNSAMDGYVFYRKDLKNNRAIPLDRHEAAAGSPPKVLPPGYCRRIYTGAPMPYTEMEGDVLAVVPIENCEENCEICGSSVRVAPGPLADHVRPQGQNYHRGERVAAQGDLCSPELFSVLASVGCGQVQTYQPLSVALCISGDELVTAGEGPLQMGQIYDSNSIYLSYQCKQLGYPTQVFHLKDDYTETQKQLRYLAQNFDVVLCSGGASVGERDYIQKVVQEEGQVFIRKVAVKPGKPFTFADFQGKPLFCLPGNPLAVYIGFLYFVLPFLRRLQGQTRSGPFLRHVPAPCELKMARRTQFIFCRDKSGSHPEPLAEQSSALLKYQYLADAALIVPAGTGTIPAGETVLLFPFRQQI
ncbi:MAG: molybdopterin molybdotransferase MoeA [Spirochaetota bacterium]